jgi:hypothetical protein
MDRAHEQREGVKMSKATLYGGRLFSSGMLMMFVAAGIVLMAIFAIAPGGTPTMAPVSVLASVGLVDDDGHQGLFNVSGLVPGRSATRCLRVRYGGPAPAGTVFFSATDITGPLAANLRIKVEQGTGGSFSSCNGFSGTAIYDGPLTSLVDVNPAAPRTTTGWSPAASDERSYRLTATMRENVSAQGQRSTATFHWFLVGGPTAAPTPAATTVTPTVAPTAVVSDPPIAVIEASATPTPATVPPGTGEPGTPVPSSARSDAPAVVTPVTDVPAPADKSPVAAQVRQVLENIGRDITEVAVRTSTHGALPVTGIAVLIGFLGVQNRIDRMDPKLAMAPAQDPHLEFLEPDKEPDTDPEPAPRPDEAVP